MNHTRLEPENQQENLQEQRAKADGSLQVSPFYHSSVNEITQPNSYTACSHYLTRRWKRDLGPTGYAILTSFRDRCFYNRKTGERREVIQVPVAKIAEECGISEKTVRRELASNKALQKFIRAQREPAPDPRRGGWRWGPNTFQVAMDDPIHPDDEQELLEIVRQKAVEADKAPEDPLARARRLAASNQSASQKGENVATSGHFDRTLIERQPQRSDCLSERPVNLTSPLDKLTASPGQIDRTLKNPDSSLLEKTLPDAAMAAPEVMASLFPGEEQEALPNKLPESISDALALKPWTQLAEAEQLPWIEKAEQELKENFGLAVWVKTTEKAKANIRAQRAANLYLQSFGLAAKRGPVELI